VSRAVYGLLSATALIGLPILAGACFAEEQGLPYDRLSISVVRQTGGGVAGFPLCITLPILNGSVVEERRSVDGALGVAVFAMNDRVELSFPGAREGAALDRAISAERLRGALIEDFTATSSSGESFGVALRSACSTQP
jgi:hypothetical protein